MHAMPFVVWFRPVSSDERVGEHSAVVCQLVYVSPVAARALMFGVSMRPPQGSIAENPVSSSTTYSTFGAPGGATGCTYGSQSGIESRSSTLIVPLNGLLIALPSSMAGVAGGARRAAPPAGSAFRPGDSGRSLPARALALVTCIG